MSKLKLKYGIGIVGAVTAFVGVAGPQALADEHKISQASLFTQRAKHDYAIQMQECDTLKNSQPDAYEPCMEKARSTRDNLLTQTQGSADAGQGSQGVGSNQSQQQFSRQEEKGPIDKMTSAVKETVAEVKEFFGSDQGREGQQGGQGQQGSGTQGQHPLQQGFDAQQMQGQGSGQGGQSLGQQGVAQGQQGQQGQSGQGSSFQGGQQPQVQSGQGSFQGGQQYGQQQQGQAGQQGTGGTDQTFQSGGTHGLQGQQGGSMSGSAGARAEHMNPAEYYQGLADQQYGTLKQECETLKQDPNVWEKCQQHAKSVRDKIAGMAEQG